MTLSVTLACGTYDRVRGLLDGSVGITGCTVVPVPIVAEDLLPRVVGGRADFDITEMSLSSYLIEISRGDCAYTAIPVFPSRGFRHSGIYIRTDRGIRTPKDLEGRLVGIPEYQMTFGLWIRGIFADEYDVDTDAIRYRTGGTNQSGRKERLPLELPHALDVAPLAPGRSLDDALAAGEIDAVLSPSPPRSFTSGHPEVARMFPDSQTEERAYFLQTGFYPIMHVVGIRTELLAQYPDLAASVYHAFAAAKTLGFEQLATMMRASVNYISIPWVEDTWQQAIALMGPDYWPYGVARNRAQLEAICRYSTHQHLSRRPLTIADLFDPTTLTLD
jgi:4,5-dihydroxyphthalate decarboxylase